MCLAQCLAQCLARRVPGEARPGRPSKPDGGGLPNLSSFHLCTLLLPYYPHRPGRAGCSAKQVTQIQWHGWGLCHKT